jgi:hypothetical protein
MNGSNILKMEELQQMIISGLAARSEPLIAHVKNIHGNLRLTVREVEE